MWHRLQTNHELVQTGEHVDWNCRKKVKQNGGLFNLSESSVIVLMFVFGLTLRCEFQTHSNSRREKSFIITLRTWVCHSTGHRFVFLGVGWSKIEATAFWMMMHKYKHLVSWDWVQSKGWAPYDFFTLFQPLNLTHGWLQVVPTRECKASCGFVNFCHWIWILFLQQYNYKWK